MRALWLSFFMAIFTFSMLGAPEAQAKRLGGGSSLGKSYSAPKKVAPAPAATPDKAAPAAATAAAAPKKAGMGGLMGGLLAGGLLGALFFGGAFEGIQFMDILMLALFGFIAFKLFSMMRKSSAPQPQYAGHPAQRTQVEEPAKPAEQPQHHFTPMSAATTQLSEPDLVLPHWFNKVAFLNGAREHFTTLQAAWDRQDWTEIETYTSPELLAALQQERAKSPAEQTTEVVSVMSELINFIDEKDHVVASIHFYGWLKESADQSATEFSEVWHLTRDMTVENAHWFIVGIEQPS